MSELVPLIREIRQKTELLVTKNRALGEENSGLKNRIRELEQSLSLQRETIKDLEEKNKLLKIAHSILSEDGDKKALKLKINEFIREIDKCMSLLND